MNCCPGLTGRWSWRSFRSLHDRDLLAPDVRPWQRGWRHTRASGGGKSAVSRKQTRPQRNPLLAGAETAMHRAAQRAQKRALETAAHARRRYGRQEIGTTCVTVTIRNPADPNRAWEGPFLVDAGATDSLVPRPHLESIGLRPKGRRVCELPDGREITMEITTADIEFMGEIVGGTILFGGHRRRTVAREDRPGIRRHRNRSEQSTAQETAVGAPQESPAGNLIALSTLGADHPCVSSTLHDCTTPPPMRTPSRRSTTCSARSAPTCA